MVNLDRTVVPGDIVKIRVIASRFGVNDKVIKVLAELLGMATEKEASTMMN